MTEGLFFPDGFWIVLNRASGDMLTLILDREPVGAVFSHGDLAKRFAASLGGDATPHRLATRDELVAFLQSLQAERVTYVAFDPPLGGGRQIAQSLIGDVLKEWSVAGN